MTGRHAAASYAHIELLAYLVTVGGDVHVVDEEGDTPLFTVENEEVGRWLIEHGADPEWKNAEEQTVSTQLSTDCSGNLMQCPPRRGAKLNMTGLRVRPQTC